MTEVKGAALAIFVKTLGFSPVKTRLANAIGTEKAEAFYRRAISIVKRNADGACTLMPEITPYWAVAERKALGHPDWQSFEKVSQEEGLLGERLATVYSLLQQRHGSVLLIGADCLELSADLIREAASILLLTKAPFVMGRAFDGGFYLFGGSRALPRPVWTDTTYSDLKTAEQLWTAVSRFGEVVGLPPLRDVDTQDDLLEFTKSRSELKSALDPPETAELLQWCHDNLEGACDVRKQ